MTVRVLLFGPQAQHAAASEVLVTLSEEATCANLREALRGQVPALASSLSGSVFAVNHEFAAEEQHIEQHDEVALIGMVAGG